MNVSSADMCQAECMFNINCSSATWNKTSASCKLHLNDVMGHINNNTNENSTEDECCTVYTKIPCPTGNMAYLIIVFHLFIVCQKEIWNAFCTYFP